MTRSAHELCETKSTPQDTPRLEAPRVFLEAAIDGFRDHVHNACAELVFKLDEIGVSEWEDRSHRSVNDERTNNLPRCPQEFETYRMFHFEVSISAPRLGLESKSQQILRLA
jgi:hypothetical protein